MSNRRKLVIALGAGALAAPFGSVAQTGKVWRIGFLAPRRIEFVESDSYYGPFRRGMRELGYVEGNNLLIEWRSAEGKYERLPSLATELAMLKLDVIVTASTSAAIAAQKTVTGVPIVIAGINDPVGDGLVKSLARPGGNITGVSNMATDLGPKLLEMLRSMVPRISRVAVLINTENAAHPAILKSIQTTARGAAVKAVLALEARSPQEIDKVFSEIAAKRNAEGAIVLQDPFFMQQRRQITELAINNRFPLIFGLREYVEAGGLMSYGSNLADQFWRAATYVDKIIKGAKPADLPVEQPTTFELYINGTTAKALGLKIPQSLRIMATKVIE